MFQVLPISIHVRYRVLHGPVAPFREFLTLGRWSWRELLLRCSLPVYSCFILTLRSSRQRRVTTTEARIIARLDALRRNRGSEKDLGQLIQEELDRTPVRERDKLLGYFERWLDRQCLTLLEEWTPKSRMVQ